MEHSNPSYIKILVSYYQTFISVKPTICLFNFKPIFVQLFIKINSYGRKLENEVGLQTRTNGGSNFFGYNFGKGACHTGKNFEMKKRQVGTVRSIRKKTEIFRRRLREFLQKKGCKKGGVSLQRAYRKLIRILDDWYRKGI